MVYAPLNRPRVGAPRSSKSRRANPTRFEWGPVSGSLEREADRAADAITRGSSPPRAAPVAVESSRSTPHEPGGAPLESHTRAFMERHFGTDFADVRVHTDAHAARQARSGDARAFAVHDDLYFAAGEYAPHAQTGRWLLAHELAHTVQQRSLGGQALARRSPGGELSSAKVSAAIQYTNKRFDSDAQREIQRMVGAEPDGDFGKNSAQALARFQTDAKLTMVDGKLGPETLDAQMRLAGVTNQSAEDSAAYVAARDVMLVAQLYDLPISLALSVHLEPEQTELVSTRFEAGSALVTLGPQAFVDSETLRVAIETGLNNSAPIDPAPGLRPQRLSAKLERAAVRFNDAKLEDPRAVRVVQSAVGATPDGVFGPDTVERIAELQAGGTDGMVDGKLDLATLEQVHRVLVEREAFDGILRLMIDYFDLVTKGAMNMRARERVPGPQGFPANGRNVPLAQGRSNSVVWISNDSLGNFEQSFRVIAHELAHTRRARTQGAGSEPAEEFEARSEELLFPGLPVSDSFLLSQAWSVLAKFEALTDAERVAAWSRFERVRALLRRRVPGLAADLLAAGRELLDSYEQQTKAEP